MGQAPFVSVIVLNYNGGSLLPRCLEALSRTDYPADAWEALLVDNASSDGSVDETARVFPWVRLVCNRKNLGFAAGNNVGMRAAPGPYVALLNTDTEVEPGWLRALVLSAEADPRVGACTAKLLFAGRRTTDGSGRGVGVVQNAGTLLLRDGSGRDRGTVVKAPGVVEHEPDDGRYDRTEEVFGLCGAACLLRKAMLEDVGYFDESFFAYYEDLDLSWRARLRGWKVLFVPAAVVWHLHSASFGEWSPLFTLYVERNRPLMLLKNAPLALGLREIARYLGETAYDGLRLLAAAGRRAGGRALLARLALRARVLAGWLTRGPAALSARRGIQASRTIGHRVIAQWMVRE